jgi:hypothetical protein
MQTKLLKSYKVQDLVFSCLRSRISYENSDKINFLFKNKNLITSKVLGDNTRVKNKIDSILQTVYDKPIFYDGNSNIEKKRDSQGYAIWKDNTVYFSFRGTRDITDITDVIDIRSKDLGNNIIVHTGFYEQFMAIENQITQDTINLINSYPIERLIFAGHSMGGSIATIASLFYARKFNDKHITCHTFGSPRTGNKTFADSFIELVDESRRVEVEEDIIPMLPINKRFIHVPNRILIRGDSNMDLFTKIKYVAENHSCENYIEKLTAFIEF